MYVSTEVMMNRFNSEKFPVAGIDGQITCIFANQEDAARRAKKWLKQGHQRSNIICKFATKTEILAQIETDIESYKDYDRRFNSPNAASNVRQLEGLKKDILASIK